jgi:hypothetical protein
MMAWRVKEFVPPSVMSFEQVRRPTPGIGEVLVEIEAIGVGWTWEQQIRTCVRQHTVMPLQSRCAPATRLQVQAILGAYAFGTPTASGGECWRIAMNQRLFRIALLLLLSARAVALQDAHRSKYDGYDNFEAGLIVFKGQTLQGVPLGVVLRVDDNPKPHGWYFLAPDFQDRYVEGEWVESGLVLKGRDQDSLSLTFQREGSSAMPSERLTLRNITTLNGGLEQRSGQQSVTLQRSLMRGPIENSRWYDFGESDAQIEKNAQAFLHAVENGNAEEAAKYVDYPLGASLNGKAVKVRNREEFLRDYTRIFTPAAIAWVKRALPHDMFFRGLPCDECSGSNTSGPEAAMVLNGDIWFSAKGALSVWFPDFPPKK